MSIGFFKFHFRFLGGLLLTADNSIPSPWNWPIPRFPLFTFSWLPNFFVCARSDYTCGIHDYGATQYAYQVGESKSQFQSLPLCPLNLTGDFQVSRSGPFPWNNYIISNKMKNVKMVFGKMIVKFLISWPGQFLSGRFSPA